MAPRVAQLMAVELKQGTEWEAEQLQSFCQTARNYVVTQGLTGETRNESS